MWLGFEHPHCAQVLLLVKERVASTIAPNEWIPGPALLLSAFSVSLGMEREVCREGSCLHRKKQGVCKAFFKVCFETTF